MIEKTNFVKNWDKDFKPGIFANEMKKFFPPARIFKTFSFLILILVLVLTPCGIKQSVKQIFNVDNLTANNIKTGSSCEYIQLKTSQKSEQVALKNKDYLHSTPPVSENNLVSTTGKTGVRKARSVPLYILYQQLRSSLV